MTRPLLVAMLAAGFALPAFAQTPYSYPSPYGPIPGPYSYAPNFYNRGTQPLSPYLNLGFSVNPAASYYYGVRPGTQGPNGLGPVYGSGAPRPPAAASRTFLPPPVPSARDQEPLAPDDRPRTSLPSPGGVASYGNVFGSSSTGVNGGRYGFFGGSSGGGSATAPRPAQPPSTIPKSR